ncbi:MAG: hypothetical protein H6728_17570, partial [Myxococcales bacterium]|nr:hypothetical protein [Myxococcales bacterium]
MAGEFRELLPEMLWHLESIGLAQARRDGFEGTGCGVHLAVLDTRAQLSHPIFKDADISLYAVDGETLCLLAPDD